MSFFFTKNLITLPAKFGIIFTFQSFGKLM